MDIKYDPKVDMAYIYLRPLAEKRKVSRSVTWEDRESLTELVLDFDSDGHFVGIEIFGASRKILPEILNQSLPYR